MEVAGGVHFVWTAILDSRWVNSHFVPALNREQFLEILGVRTPLADVVVSCDFLACR